MVKAANRRVPGGRSKEPLLLVPSQVRRTPSLMKPYEVGGGLTKAGVSCP